MIPERFERIEELYHAAREKTAEERVALLSQVDPDLRREVESLLAERSAGEFLDRPAIQNAPHLVEDPTLTGTASGTSLGPYRIESKLGEGGMGEVYRAIDTRLGRAVAIKTTREQFSARFEREARAIASLNHPNICTLFDVGPNYLVMELVEGETIAARLKSGPIPVETALLYSSQILAALAEAHGKGIVHRDLKPGNVMIAKTGIKVLDFGLAKSEQDETLTASRMVMGTPAYMAPEQREGKPADARSDIYSFGCVLHEMVTGERAGSRHKRIPSRKLEAIVDRCLEEDPARRWQSVAALERELSTAPAVTSGKRNAMAIALAGAAVIGLAVAGYFYFGRAPKLTDKDTVVLASFTNRTGDPIFDGTLRQGLSVQLAQSPFLSLVSDDRIQRALRMMGQKPDARLTPEIAQDLCQRVGSAAVIEGSIAQIGTPYLLTVKAIDCSNGETLASTEVQASDKNHVLDALGKAASELRGKLGESLSTVQKFNTPLEQATTPSLEALKAYSEGMRNIATGNDTPAAIPFIKRAIELDPNFAQAYAMLSVQYTGLGESSLAADYARKAYELRAHASEPEKYFATSRYEKSVTGNIAAAIQTCLLWIAAYPRSWLPRTLLEGAIYPVVGEYRKAIAEGKAAIRLDPNGPAAYALLMEDYTALNRLDEAKATYEQARARKLQETGYALDLYQIAFLQNDSAGMARQVAASVGKPGTEDQVLASEAETAAYFGQLKKARDFSRQAMDSAERADESETAAAYLGMSAVREALFGNAREARQRATSALERSTARDVQYAAALTFAFAGDDGRAEALAGGLSKNFPEDTLVQFSYLPALRGRLALNQRNVPEALSALQPADPYPLAATRFSTLDWIAMYPTYVRGQAYLAARQGGKAAAEFQKILDHPGIVCNSPIAALAHLQIARAYAMEAETSKARAAYQAFFTLWKNADPDIPVLNQARSEYAKLQ